MLDTVIERGDVISVAEHLPSNFGISGIRCFPNIQPKGRQKKSYKIQRKKNLKSAVLNQTEAVFQV